MKQILVFLLLFIYGTTLFSNTNCTTPMNNQTIIEKIIVPNLQNQNSKPLTLDHIDKIGGILEPAAALLGTQINTFGIFLTIIAMAFSAIGYLGIFKPMDEKINKMDNMIKQEVRNQIIYSTDGELDKVKEYAVKKIDYEIKDIKSSIHEKLFEYQNLVYLVNQKIKEDSDVVLEKDNLTDEQKLKEIINIQYNYNEITNNDLPKLFSDSFSDIVQISKQLSEYSSIKSIITIYLVNLCKSHKIRRSNKIELEGVLKKYYGYNCDI